MPLICTIFFCRANKIMNYLAATGCFLCTLDDSKTIWWISPKLGKRKGKWAKEVLIKFCCETKEGGLIHRNSRGLFADFMFCQLPGPEEIHTIRNFNFQLKPGCHTRVNVTSYLQPILCKCLLACQSVCLSQWLIFVSWSTMMLWPEVSFPTPFEK